MSARADEPPHISSSSLIPPPPPPNLNRTNSFSSSVKSFTLAQNLDLREPSLSDHGDEYPESSIPRDDGTEIGFALGGTGSHTDTEAYSDVLAIEVGVENEEGSEGSKVVPDVSKNVDQDIKNDGGSEVVNEYPESRFWHTRKYQDVSSSSWIRNMDLVSLLGKEEQEQVGHPQSPDNNNDKQDEEEARKLHKMMRITQSMESDVGLLSGR